MLNQEKLAAKISRLTKLPKQEVQVVLGQLFAELSKTFDPNHPSFLVLGRPDQSDEFLANPKTYPDRHRVVLATKALGNEGAL